MMAGIVKPEREQAMSKSFDQLSLALEEVIAAAAPSVVRVEARQRLPATGIVWSADGHIVTANHIVETDEDIHIGLDDGKVIPASVVGRDPATDLLVLRAESDGLAVPEWTAAGELKAGALAVAAGRPYQNVEVSVGSLSAVGGPWRTREGGRLDTYLRPEITMYPGFSGGPLVVAGSKFAGLNTSGLLHHADTTICAQTLKRIVETLVTHGRIPRGYLGVGVQPVRISAAQAGAAGSETGLMVMSVEENSPAESAGVRQGDILVALGEYTTAAVGDLRQALSSTDAEGVVNLRVIRSNEIVELPAKLELR